MGKLMAILKYMNKLLNAINCGMIGMIFLYAIVIVYDNYATRLEVTQNLAVRVYPEHEIKELVELRANEASIDPLIVKAIIEQESAWEQFAVGDGRDSRGLMQIQFKHHKDLCGLSKANELLDADTNIKCGIKVLKQK